MASKKPPVDGDARSAKKPFDVQLDGEVWLEIETGFLLGHSNDMVGTMVADEQVAGTVHRELVRKRK